MLTAATAVTQRVAGLGLGADDYLTKPFAFAELAARIQALGRRARPAAPPVLERAGIRLGPHRRTVTRDAQPVWLSRKEFAVLAELLRAQGGVVSLMYLFMGQALDRQLTARLGISQHLPEQAPAESGSTQAAHQLQEQLRAQFQQDRDATWAPCTSPRWWRSGSSPEDSEAAGGPGAGAAAADHRHRPDAHGGEVHATPRQDGGLTVRVRLPATPRRRGPVRSAS